MSRSSAPPAEPSSRPMVSRYLNKPSARLMKSSTEVACVAAVATACSASSCCVGFGWFPFVAMLAVLQCFLQVDDFLGDVGHPLVEHVGEHARHGPTRYLGH